MFRRLRKASLLLVVVQDHAAVLGPHVRPLPLPLAIGRRRVMSVPEYLQEMLIGNQGWIVLYLYHLGVAGATARHLSVIRVVGLSARVADAGSGYAF